MKVKITNSGEDGVSIIREMTEEQYYFLLSIAEELDAKAITYAPFLSVKPIEQDMERLERKIGEKFEFEDTKLQVIKKEVGCKGCYFNKKDCKSKIVIEKIGYCAFRKDGKRVMFREVKTK